MGNIADSAAAALPLQPTDRLYGERAGVAVLEFALSDVAAMAKDGMSPDTHTHDGLMTAAQSSKLNALPTAAALADAQAAQDLAIDGKADAAHTHTLLMTAGERTKLTDLPTAAELTTAQAAQDTAISGRMLNTADAIADVLEAAPAGDMARIQSAVSEDLVLSATDAAANSAKIVAAGGGRVPPGVWPIAPIAASVDITLTGHGKHRAVLTSAANATGYLIQSTGRVCIKDVGIRGVNNYAKGYLTTAAGTQSGVLLDARNGSYIKDAAVYGFGNIGVGIFGDSSGNDLGPSIGGCDIYNNFAGIDTGNGLNATGLGEYAKIYGNTILENTYGIIVRSGNVNISGANSIQSNGEGVWVVGAANNAAHGCIVGNMINHAHRVSLRIEGVPYGQIITSNAIFSNTASIIMSSSAGVQLENNLIFAASINFSGPAWNSFARNVFYGAMPTISDTSGTRWLDNYSMATAGYVGNKSTFEAGKFMTYTDLTGPIGANKCANGDFVDVTGWTAQAGWAIGGGVATATGAGTYLFRALNGGNKVGKYLVEFDMTKTAGGVQVGIGGNLVSPSQTTAGRVVFVLNVTSGTDGNLYIVANGFTGTLDNIVVREYQETGVTQSTQLGATEFFYVGTTKYFSGTGTPEGVVSAAVGAEYTRTDGAAGTSAAPGTLKYVKTLGSAATGWTAVL